MVFITDGHGGNVTNISGWNSLPHEGHEVHGSPYAILFIFTACCIGAIVRQVMKGWPIPYTVVLIILGMCFGAISGTHANIKKYTNMATEDPHLILTTFLPVLLFESAFAMDVHIFYRMFSQILILAIFGLVVATLLSGIMAKMVFTYNWTWFEALLFGSVISATDPVAVVALLNDLGAPKQLSTIIEGESLLNDGMAIVLYKIFYNLSFSTMTGVEIGLYFPRVALGGFVFGLVVGKVTVFWLQHVFNDAMVEITITLAATYLTFYIGEEVLGISGVLAVVMLGIEINQQKTSISPEVEAFLHRFWEMLAYLANTLIFIMVGVVIMEKALTILENSDPFLIIVDYLGVTVIRALVLITFSPLLVHTGYGLDWQNGVVIMWGGLRGAVGLALALQVAIDHPEVGGKLLIHTAGIVMFTLLLNATTMKKLLEKLGMSEISDSKKIAMANGVRRVRESNDRTLKMLKSDRFLADADWTLAEKFCVVHNPYMEYEGEHEEETPVLTRHSTCPNCETSVPNEPSAKEFKEMTNDGRIRVIKAQKISYWKQFEHGMLSREAVQVLTALADASMDEPDSFVEANDLQPFWKVPPTLQKLKDKLQALCQTKSADRIPMPANRIQLMMYHIAVHFMFDVVMHSLIILNLIPIIMEMTADDSAWYIGILRIVNYVFTSIYCLEAIWKICAFREFYFKDYWNLLDLLIVLLSLIDIVIDESADGATEGFSSNVLKVSKVFRFLRMGRVLRLLKTVLPKMINALNNIINRKLSLGYDVGKGHIVAQEEVLKLVDHMVVDKRISRDLKSRTEQNRLDIVKSLGMLQREHPGIGISVKTRQAIRTILNNGRDVIQELRGGGLLDETEAARLEGIVEVKMKQQLSAPPSIPPPKSETLLRNVLWLENMEEEAKDSIASVAEMRVFGFGDTITRQGDEVDGIYLIISGMIKMIGVSVSKQEKSRDQYLPGDDISHGDMMVTTDYLSAGNMIGEWGMLTGIARNSSCTCETSVQAYFIPKKKMLKIMEKYPPLNERMWHVCGVRMAVPLLMEEPAYHNWTKDKIRLMCERSYIAKLPPPGPSGTFSTTEQMKEAVLIQGRLTCVETHETHEGPCVLPRAYRLFKVLFDLEPKVLVIVRKNSIMPISDEEEMADMQDQPSAADLLGIRVSQQQMAHSISRHSAIGSLMMKTVRSSSMAPQTAVRHRGNSFEQAQQERTRRNTTGSQATSVGIGEGLRNRIPDPLPDTYPGPRHIIVAPSPVRGFHEEDVDETHDA